MKNDWKKIREELVYDGWRKVMRKEYLTPDGKETAFDTRFEKDIVVTLALTPDNKVIIARQFRVGPEEVFGEIPGGVLDEGEDPQVAAARELREETGYEGTMQFVGTDYVDAYSNRKRYSFIATGCTKVADQAEDDQERIEVVEMPLEEFRMHLRSGRLSDSATGYKGLEHLGLL